MLKVALVTVPRAMTTRPLTAVVRPTTSLLRPITLSLSRKPTTEPAVTRQLPFSGPVPPDDWRALGHRHFGELATDDAPTPDGRHTSGGAHVLNPIAVSAEHRHQVPVPADVGHAERESRQPSRPVTSRVTHRRGASPNLNAAAHITDSLLATGSALPGTSPASAAHMGSWRPQADWTMRAPGSAVAAAMQQWPRSRRRWAFVPPRSRRPRNCQKGGPTPLPNIRASRAR
jgi:hypothetical protein